MHIIIFLELDVDEDLLILKRKGIQEVSINQFFRLLVAQNCEEMCLITFGDLIKKIPHFMLRMINDIRDSRTHIGDTLQYNRKNLVYDYIKVAQRQHGGSFLWLIRNPRITWVCSLTIKDEESNVSLLGFTPIVF